MQYVFISNTTGTADLHKSPAPQFQNFQVFLIYFPKSPSFSIKQGMLKMQQFTSFFLKFMSNLQVTTAFFLLNAIFAMTILDLVSHVHLFVTMLPKK